MWGICLDYEICEGKLGQRVIEYQIFENKAIVLQPVSDIEIDAQKIKVLEQAPRFVYGAQVYPKDHPEYICMIRDIIWHFKDKVCYYYLEAEGKKIGKRYAEEELAAH